MAHSCETLFWQQHVWYNPSPVSMFAISYVGIWQGRITAARVSISILMNIIKHHHKPILTACVLLHLVAVIHSRYACRELRRRSAKPHITFSNQGRRFNNLCGILRCTDTIYAKESVLTREAIHVAAQNLQDQPRSAARSAAWCLAFMSSGMIMT